MNVPGDLKYTKDHEWAKKEGDNIRVGITDYAQKELGDIVFVEFKAKGTKLRKGDAFGTVESVKAVSDIYAPASGQIVDANTGLADKPELVNQDCYGEAWMVVMSLDNPDEFNSLMDAAAYTDHVKAEAK